MAKRLVFLVPGFFGFTSVGAVSYFEDVERSLALALRRRGVEARVVRCMTQPTASIPRRADALRRQVIRSGGLGARELHFVGHSTGGLDVRMLLTPGVKIASGGSGERIARLTRTAIFRQHAAPRHAARQSLHHRPGPDAAAGAECAGDVGTGPSRDLRGGQAVGLVATLDDWIGRSGSLVDRMAGGLLRQDPRRPPRTRVEIPRRHRAGPGRGAAAHAGGHRVVRCDR